MLVKHELTVLAKCPENGQPDAYIVEVWLDRLVLCESLMADCDKFHDKAMHQEAVTQALADMWRATVRTTGTHCRGAVRTICTCTHNSHIMPVNPSGDLC